MSLFDSPGNLGGRLNDPRLINPLLAPPGAHGRWGAPGADWQPVGHVGDEAGRRGLGYDQNRPTGGGNFNPNIAIDTSHVAAARPVTPPKKGRYLPKTPPPPGGAGGGLGGTPPPPGRGGGSLPSTPGGQMLGQPFGEVGPAEESAHRGAIGAACLDLPAGLIAEPADQAVGGDVGRCVAQVAGHTHQLGASQRRGGGLSSSHQGQ
jgi:hypothetical protein